MGKSSKAPQQKESESEKALAQVSEQKWNRYKSMYRPVEANYINEVSKDVSGTLRGRNTADIAQASAGSFGDAVSLGMGGAGRLGATAENMGAARSLGALSGNSTAMKQRDIGRMNALKIGSNMSADAQQGLAMAARASNTEAIGRARAQSIKNEGTREMIGTVAGMLGGAYVDSKREMWAEQMDKPLRDRRTFG